MRTLRSHTHQSRARSAAASRAVRLPGFATPDALADALADAVIGWDADRRIVLWNRAAETMYGYTREEALGRRPAELLSTRFPMPLTTVIDRLAETGTWTGELVQRAKDGSELTVDSCWLAVRDEQGRLCSATSVDRDITARLQDNSDRERLQAAAERELLSGRLQNVQRLESVGQIAGGIAHDFNNMLAVIINYAALIAAELDALALTSPDPERWESMSGDLHEIQLAADRAARLTHALLAFSRQTQPNAVPIDLGDSVREVEELLRRTLGTQVQLDMALDDSLALIRADPTEIDHLLINLAVNSRDAMPDGGTLTIDTANVEIDADYAAPRAELLPGRYVRLRVSDTGAGMSPEVIEHAFDPFFTTKPLGKGTGLGLATVFGIVRQARGRADFYSEPGVGTTFSALFPVDPAQSRTPSPRAAPPPAPAGQTILLVEDEDALLQATRRILSGAGYRVLAAEHGAAALEVAAGYAGQIDLLLTDVVMPGIHGHELATQLRAVRPSLRTLYMSGFAGPVLRAAIDMDAAELIEKPFTAPRLLERIGTLLAPAQA